MVSDKSPNSFKVIYASQTGQAQVIAESIFDLAGANNFDAKIFSIKDYGKTFTFDNNQDPIVFVCSTTGDGEVPETAFRCWNKLKRITSETNPGFLKNLNYALLGLGDTNYTTFAGGPKLFHKKFTELGANCFFGPFYADDGTGMDLVVEPFKEDLWKALNDHMNKQRNLDPEPMINITPHADIATKVKNISLADIDLTIPVLAENILTYELTSPHDLLTDTDETTRFFMSLQASSELYEASVTSNIIMTHSTALKTCYNIKFQPEKLHKLEDNLFSTISTQPDFVYEPGDSISILTPNDSEEVTQLLKRLNIQESGGQVLHLQTLNPKKISGKKYVELTSGNQVSLFNFFKYCVDIRSGSIKKALIRMLANYCTEKLDQTRLLELCSKEGAEQFQSLLKESHLSLLDLLTMFKSCDPPLGHLIQNLSPLIPRSYSLCSFHTKDNSQLEIVFNLVNFDCSLGRTYERKGLATGYLSKLNKDEKLFFQRRKFQGFTFPTDEQLVDKALIMIGPGTGIAPFISYLRAKYQIKAFDKYFWLFYGCRDPQKDFLFKSEIIEFSPVITKCSLAFSRVSSLQDDDDLRDLKDLYGDCKYVQDSIRQNAKELCRLIFKQQAYVYVCGDARNMSKDVQKCLSECLSEECQISLEDANKYLIEMMKEKRFKQDIWA